jgi:hypothetical protein
MPDRHIYTTAQIRAEDLIEGDIFSQYFSNDRGAWSWDRCLAVYYPGDDLPEDVADEPWAQATKLDDALVAVQHSADFEKIHDSPERQRPCGWRAIRRYDLVTIQVRGPVLPTSINPQPQHPTQQERNQ